MPTQLAPPQPMQPVVRDERGRLRFRENRIVRHLLDHGGIGLDALGLIDFPVEDREQFAQLLGHSLDGYAELSHVRPESVAAADAAARRGTDPQAERIAVLEVKLAKMRDFVREVVPELFNVDADVLDG